VEDIAARDGGTIFDVEDVILGPADPATQARLDLYPQGVERELQSANDDLDKVASDQGGYSHLLISRRMKNTYNSTGPELSLLKSKGTTNPAYIHPADLESMGIADGEVIEVYSSHGQVPAVAAASPDIKPGVVSMSHCWGDSPAPEADSDSRVKDIGSNTNRLVDNRHLTEKYSGMCRQSSIPVSIRRL